MAYANASRPRAALALLLLALAVAAEITRWPSPAPDPVPALPGATATSETALPRLVEVSSSILRLQHEQAAEHASSLAQLPGGDLLAVWWAGSRESGPDVRVYAARWHQGRWNTPRAVVDRQMLGREFGFAVRRIGNPVAWVAPDGAVHLFMVGTGLGGWAAARVLHLVSHDTAATFSAVRVLPLSPLFNTSMLVRTNAVGLADGRWWLPAYFELGTKYPLVLTFDEQGRLQRLQRLGKRTNSLQPAIAPIAGSEWRAWMRDMGPDERVQQAVSQDAGRTWQDLSPTDVPNHNNSVAVLRLERGGYVMLHNDQVAPGASGRSLLRLRVSTDALNWQPLLDVAKGRPSDEFSYPTLLQVGDRLHVTYSLQRSDIAHHVFQLQYEQDRQ